MNDFLVQLNTLVSNNQILSTIAGGSVIVWLVSNIKAIFFKTVDFIKSIVSFNIVNVYEDNRGSGHGITREQEAFLEFIDSTRALWERTKSLDLSNHQISQYADVIKHSQVYGFSLRIMFGKLVLCNRSISTQQKISVSTNLTVFFASKKKFMKQLDDAIAKTTKAIEECAENIVRDNVCIYFNQGYCNSTKFKRSPSTIFTNDDIHLKLMSDVKSFINNKKTYQEVSSPYSFSALLYGEPGCGKTSTILAIASELNYDIAYINPAKASIATLMSYAHMSRTIFVFEDIDAVDTKVNVKRNDEDDIEPPENVFIKEGLSLSELLNVTDGLLSNDGTIMLFTTNHIEKLDPAFLRKGRMNETVKFTEFTPKTANKMIEHHLGYNIEGLADRIKPAELQDMILQIKLGKATREDLVKKFAA